MMIVLEGIDGVGKSALSRQLAKRLDATLLKAPPAEYGLTGEYLDRDPTTMSHFLFYLSGAVSVSEQADRLISMGGRVVCDRYVYSSFAYHRPFLSPPFSLHQVPHRAPTHAFLLTADESVRRARLDARSEPPSLIEDLLSRPETREAVVAEYRSYPNLKEIDTSAATLAELTDEIARLVG